MPLRRSTVKTLRRVNAVMDAVGRTDPHVSKDTSTSRLNTATSAGSELGRPPVGKYGTGMFVVDAATAFGEGVSLPKGSLSRPVQLSPTMMTVKKRRVSSAVSDDKILGSPTLLLPIPNTASDDAAFALPPPRVPSSSTVVRKVSLSNSKDTFNVRTPPSSIVNTVAMVEKRDVAAKTCIGQHDADFGQILPTPQSTFEDAAERFLLSLMSPIRGDPNMLPPIRQAQSLLQDNTQSRCPCKSSRKHTFCAWCNSMLCDCGSLAAGVNTSFKSFYDRRFAERACESACIWSPKPCYACEIDRDTNALCTCASTRGGVATTYEALVFAKGVFLEDVHMQT